MQVKLLFFLNTLEKKLWCEGKLVSEKKIKPSRLHNSTCFSTPAAGAQVFIGDKKTHDITKGEHRSAQRLLLWSKEDLLLFFSNELPGFAEGAGDHLSCATPVHMVWTSESHFVRTVSPRGGRASFIARQRPGQGCDATSRSSPRIYFSGLLPLGRRKNCGRRQRNGGHLKEKQKKWT